MLSYDPLGRLWQVAGSGIGDVRWLHDGDELVAEYSPGTGAIVRRYVHGPGADEPLVLYEGADLSARRLFHADHQGSVIALTDTAGNLAAVNA